MTIKMSQLALYNRIIETDNIFCKNDKFKKTIQLIDDFLEQTENDNILWYSNYLNKNVIKNDDTKISKTKDFHKNILYLMQFSTANDYTDDTILPLIESEIDILMQINDILVFFINPTN